MNKRTGPRVLVVDDDPRVRSAMTAELAAAGCRPTAAAPEDLPNDPWDALDPEQIDVALVDVALVDVALPTVADGLALIRQLSSAVRVVAISINGAARTQALAAGARAYLEKDGDTDRLLRTLHAMHA